MPSDEQPLSREEFRALMEIEAKKLDRLARELREGKWETYSIEELFTPKDGGRVQETATIVIRVSRVQAYGSGRTAMTDGEASPSRPHQFDGSWQPHPEKRGDEHERYEVTCSACDLTIPDPTDAYPVEHCPAVKALTREWLALMGYPEECAPKAKGETAVRAADVARAR
jgi:hypothetical protein